MKKIILLVFLVLFGSITLFMSSSVLFDWFGIREKEGDFVPAVVWANWLCAILYLAAAAAILKNRTWAKLPLIIALIILVAAYAYLFVHIRNGGLFETKTVAAMAFRIGFTILLLLATIKISNKMKNIIVPALLCLIFFTACEKKHDSSADEDHTASIEQMATDHDKEEDHSATGVSLELDNGKKWATNAEMLPFIQQQEKLINEYDYDSDDYHKLAEGLNSANEKLIKSCTMTEKSHDMLHVWLNEHMSKITSLSKAASNAEADKILDELEHSMETYRQYFK